MKSSIVLILCAVIAMPNIVRAQSLADRIDIPYEKFELDNGLTVIVHEDHKAPIVAVNIWYHVGSKNEKAGKTGFAHLFEHLMFNGSENYNDDYFKVVERAGATDLNGTTNQDRTNYFQNVPTSTLDQILWMESDRMGHLLGAVDQARLDEQRGVVQNEKRQGENQPYGKVRSLLYQNAYPKGHPYSWTVIGEMEDLDAASLEDVHEWFKTYYGPNNAVLVLAGDITVDQARTKAQHFFGDIPPGPPIAKQSAWISKRSGEHRLQMEDRVPQARVYKVWNVPEWGHPDLTQLDLASDVLSAGKSSRLYKRLVYDDQIATGVYAYVSDSEVGGRFTIVATAKPGQDLAQVERAVDEEMTRLLNEGPTQEELDRVRTGFFSDFIRGMERIGGFGGKSDILAENEVYGGSPDFFKKVIRRVESATTESVHKAAKKWLSDGVLVIEVHPFKEGVAASEGADRSELPEIGPQPLAAFPRLQHATLSNGLKVVLAERHAVPVVNFRLVMDAGYAADQFGLPGTASLAMNMLDEGTTTRSALEISDELELLGAQLSSGSDLDNSIVRLSALKWNLGPSLDLFADVVLNPAFPEADFERLKAQQIAQIQREKATPIQMALRVFPKLLYGEEHAYGNPLTGSGTEESVGTLTRQNLMDFHETWFRPNNATLIVAGDATLDEIIPMLEQRIGGWRSAPVPTKNIAAVPHKSDQVIYLMDRPGSQQSIIFAGHVAPPTGNPHELAIETMMDALGGSFTSRINMNLREAKGWSYGAFAFMYDAEGQRPFITYAPVQSDKTKESMAEISLELRGMKGENPVTTDEVNRAKDNLTLTLPGRWETLASVEGGVAEIVRFGLDDDYWDTYAASIRSLSEGAVSDAAAEVLHPGQLVWVVVGDRSVVEPAIQELGYGRIELVDADGMSITGGARKGI